MSDPEHSLRPLLEGYLESLAGVRGASPHTLRAYGADLQELLATLETNGVTEVTQLADRGEARIREHLYALVQKGLDPRSVSRKMAAVRSFFTHLVNQKIMAGNPARSLDTPRQPARLSRALSREETEEFLGDMVPEAEQEVRDRAIFELMYGSGLRVSELCSLDTGSFSPGFDSFVVRGKGGRERMLPLGGEARTWLLRYMKEVRPITADVALFLNARGKRLSSRGVRYLLDRHLLSQGFGKRFSPHVLRHSFATHLLDQGAGLRTVQELLGHQRITTTQGYTKISLAKLRDTLEQTHPHGRKRRTRAGSPGGEA